MCRTEKYTVLFFIDKMLPGLIKVSYLITTARA